MGGRAFFEALQEISKQPQAPLVSPVTEAAIPRCPHERSILNACCFCGRRQAATVVRNLVILRTEQRAASDQAAQNLRTRLRDLETENERMRRLLGEHGSNFRCWSEAMNHNAAEVAKFLTTPKAPNHD